jgi:eco57I restriction endonuclease
LLRQILLKYLERKNITPNDKFLKKMNQIIDSLIDCDININGIIDKEYNTVEEIAYSLNTLFSADCKKNNGVYFTPLTTTDLMVEQVLLENNIKRPLVLDPAVGSGILLIRLARELVKKNFLSIKVIIEKYLYGIDKLKENVEVCKLMLLLLAFEINQSVPNRINIFCMNSLSIDFDNLKDMIGADKFDIIISNPPYIGSKLIDQESKSLLKRFSDTVYGNPDIYIVFFEIAIRMIKAGGVCCFITPNSFFRSLNGKKLRKYLINQTSEIKLIDFEGSLVFDKVLHYSAITVFRKKIKSGEINRIQFLTNYSEDSTKDDFIWENIEPRDSWQLLSGQNETIIDKLENKFKFKLNDFDFKNGVATQRNSIYIFSYRHQDNKYYYFMKDDYEYKVEKLITRPCVLPNIKKQDPNLRIIFPYEYNTVTQTVCSITPDQMCEQFPYALEYLKVFKDELSLRKVDSKMEYWYLYGRSQGLNQYGPRLYLPYISGQLSTHISNSDDEVFAAGYAIFHENYKVLLSIGRLLESKLFHFYISRVSKPYSSGYYSTAKNMIKNFSVPDIEILKTIDNKSITDELIYNLYGLTQSEIIFLEAELLKLNS